MPKRIIFPNDIGGIALITPAIDCGLSVDEIARKDVPAGRPYVILDTVDVPTDFTFFDAWEGDFSQPHGTGVGSHAWFIAQYQAEIASINAETGPEAPRHFDALPMADIAEIAHIVDEAEKQAIYDAYLARVQAENDALTAQHTKAVEAWEASKAQRIEQLNMQIAVQQEEMAE